MSRAPGDAGPAAVLFDLDGVLIDSFEAWFATVNEVAERFGVPGVSRAWMKESFGQGVQADADTVFAGRAVEEIQAAYDATLPRHVGLMTVTPGAPEVLEGLAARGRRRAVVTNTQASLAARILGSTGLRTRVDTWTAVGPGLREKPHPDLLLAALDRLEVPPGRALMVGDSPYDERAARAAGTDFLHFDVRTGAELRGALAPLLA